MMWITLQYGCYILTLVLLLGCCIYNRHGGICVKGKIYAHPSHAETVLEIDTNTISEEGEPSISELTIHRADYDEDPRKNYKWYACAYSLFGPHGK